MVLLALKHVRERPIRAQQDACERRAVNWLLGMQSKDGGWAAFDVDNNWQTAELRAVRRPQRDARSYLPRHHRPRARSALRIWLHRIASRDPARRRVPDAHAGSDGSWYGRWGVDYIYGTFLALRGLRAAGESDREAYILRAGEWLRSIQNPTAAGARAARATTNSNYVAAPSTPSQTAWAVLGLLAGGDTTSISVQNGVEYLIDTQRPTEPGTRNWPPAPDSPRCFICYHLYRDSFPLLALSTFLKTRTPDRGER